MIKKVLTFAFLLTATFATFAQHVPGSWQILPMKGEYFDYVLDTPDKVYYLTGGVLYSYDKEYNETTYYAPGSDITDSGISKIYYNRENDYIAIIYNNCNIDLLYPDGRLYNLPEIKNATMTAVKTINHVFFHNNSIYVATSFGIVVFDDQNLYQVKESGIFNVNVKHIMATKDYLLIDMDGKLWWSPITERHNKADKFTECINIGINFIELLDDNTFLYVPGSGENATAFKLSLDLTNNKVNHESVRTLPNISDMRAFKDGFYALCDEGIVTIDKTGAVVETKALDEDLMTSVVTFWEGLNSVWAADNMGIANYDLTTNPRTVLADKYLPEGSLDFACGYKLDSADKKSVYLTRMGFSAYFNGATGWDAPFIFERYDWATSTFTQLHPYNVTNYVSYGKDIQKNDNTHFYVGGAGPTAVDPVDPSIIYHANNMEGLVVIKDGKVLKIFDKSNSLVSEAWLSRTYACYIDPRGNLWVFTAFDTSKSNLVLLTADKLEKLREDISSVQKSDWQTFPEPNENNMPDVRACFSTKSNKMVYTRSSASPYKIGVDTKGTNDVSDDTYNVFTAFIDQDGTITGADTRTIIEDLDGNMWFATSNGVYVLENLEQLGNSAYSDNLLVRRPKVARNDGTNFADYLLNGEDVYDIAVDASNRKWLATINSGVYLVSADGTEILQQFTKDNSPLVTDAVYVVACDPLSNDVLFATHDGMFLYSSTASPAADDYSNVYAYPNPVRPDYSGWVTINGLMENSLVKITDVRGNVLWETRSEGGMVVWDACNRDGRRVATGVYFVMASQNENDNTMGIVTKIVVVN